MSRIESRQSKDRIEKEEREFFERVRSVFIDRSQLYPERIKLIDASQSIEQVQQQIQLFIEAL
jgi:dTMP kinase